MDLKLIIGVVIVVIILYLIWSYFFTSIQVIMSFQQGIEKSQSTVKGKSVAKSGKNNYSFSLWTYISDWNVNYGEQKNILAISSATPSVGAPTYVFQLMFDSTRNDLLINVDFDGGHGTAPEPTQPISVCKVSNFPIQSWVNISVSVYNRAVDVYIDGKLVRTCPLMNVASPISAQSTIYIGGTSGGTLLGFEGYIASVIYNPDVISPQDAWNIYARGYSNTGGFGFGNLFQRYKLQFAFLKDNSVVNSLTI
jgi:Concanavalin A-like lectin/glucanases superfamily